MPETQRDRHSLDRHYDVIVIGSGIGGLATASLLAQIKHQRVLVLERHFKLGGFTHTFSRKGYTWDVGVHYVGEMESESQARQIMNLITGNGVEWHRLPEVLEHVVFPGFSFDIRGNAAQFESDLIACFPAEAQAIARYFRDLRTLAGWITRYAMANLLPAPIARLMTLPGRRMALLTTKAYLDQHFSDPKLKALLAAQWGDYGLPPAQSAFISHALIAAHYLNGAYYPEGGADRIPECIQPIIEAAGGACLVNHEVSEILVKAGAAVGVRVKTHGGRAEQDFFAPLIISDAGRYTTFMRLLPRSLNLPEQHALAAPKASMSTTSIYIGFKSSPAVLGFKGENHWLYDGLDHDALNRESGDLLEGRVPIAYLSFASLKDPKAGKHTAQIIAPIDYQHFAAWRESTWKRRGQGYEALKANIAQNFLDLAEKHYPGFKALVDYYEVSTPLSIETFTGHYAGGIYGIPAMPERFARTENRIKTPIKGLFLTGADVVSLGIVGALMGGVMAAAAQLGPMGFFTITGLAKQTQQSAIRPSVAVSEAAL
jgi:phytoene dehydrogenase-like protein